MRAYTVHAPPGEPRPERFAFVKDGFSWPALFVPILWILWHRMWLTLIGYVIFVLLVAWTGRLAGDAHAMILALTGSFILALEGNTIRRLSLEQLGWREIGESFGSNLSEAEIRFFHRRADVSTYRSEEPAQRTGLAGGPGARENEERVLGLFPEPER